MPSAATAAQHFGFLPSAAAAASSPYLGEQANAGEKKAEESKPASSKSASKRSSSSSKKSSKSGSSKSKASKGQPAASATVASTATASAAAAAAADLARFGAYLTHPSPMFPPASLLDTNAAAAAVAVAAAAAHKADDMIRLPTKPLDISQVKTTTLVKESATAAKVSDDSPPAAKRRFVRPFEDDFGGSKANVNGSGNNFHPVESNNNEVKAISKPPEPTEEIKAEQFTVLRSIMTAPPMSARSTASAVAASSDSTTTASTPTTTLTAASSLKQDECPALAADNVFKEPVTKEKLNYLRYFRLGTHRKKIGTRHNFAKSTYRC